MHVETTGTGPALVLVHGWAMHGGLFAPLVEALADRHTLHVVDLPGHGRSAERDTPLHLRSLADRLVAQLPRAIWLGWSLGGLVALQAAQTHPGAVRGLALVAATPRFVRSDDWPAGMGPEIFTGFATDLDRDYRATLDRFLMLEAQGSDHMRQELRLLRDQVYARGEPSPAALHDGLRLLNDSDLRAGLPALAMPSLWIAGRRDRLVSPAAMRAAAALAPRAHFVQVEGGGHAPFLTHAGEVARALDDFTAGLPA